MLSLMWAVENERDRFQDLDAGLESDLDGLISQTIGHCSAAVYINGDNDIPTCAKFDDDNWEERLLHSLTE